MSNSCKDTLMNEYLPSEATSTFSVDTFTRQLVIGIKNTLMFNQEVANKKLPGSASLFIVIHPKILQM